MTGAASAAPSRSPTRRVGASDMVRRLVVLEGVRRVVGVRPVAVVERDASVRPAASSGRGGGAGGACAPGRGGGGGGAGGGPPPAAGGGPPARARSPRAGPTPRRRTGCDR